MVPARQAAERLQANRPIAGINQFMRNAGVDDPVFDIDRFKTVNDRYGHATGDQVLAMVARTLQSNLRSWDAVGRWGGEEFLVLCRNVDAPTLREVAERLRLLVESSHCRGEDGGDVQVTVSAGGTMTGFEDTPELLVARADALMYRSKQDGRNRISFG